MTIPVLAPAFVVAVVVVDAVVDAVVVVVVVAAVSITPFTTATTTRAAISATTPLLPPPRITSIRMMNHCLRPPVELSCSPLPNSEQAALFMGVGR